MTSSEVRSRIGLIERIAEDARREGEVHYVQIALRYKLSHTLARNLMREAAIVYKDLEYHRGYLRRRDQSPEVPSIMEG